MTVHLVGAGPGDADLLTVRAHRLISCAEVVVYDRLIDQSVLSLAPRSAELIDVGKRPGGSHTQVLINDLLIALGREHDCVVRLKGGDPFVFGRGGEEALALMSAGIDFTVVPGVTSAFSAPLAAGIPVTHRSVARGVTVVTGHAGDGDEIDYARLAHPEISLVVLMGVSERSTIASALVSGGLDPKTPAAVIEWAWTSRQRVVRAPLDELGALDVTSPAVIVIGAVAAFELDALTATIAAGT